jgi:hypothetical protein
VPRIDSDVRDEILQYLDACGEQPGDYDVDAMAAVIVAEQGCVELDDIKPDVFAGLLRIYRRHDTLLRRFAPLIRELDDEQRHVLLLLMAGARPDFMARELARELFSRPAEGR